MAINIFTKDINYEECLNVFQSVIIIPNPKIPNPSEIINKDMLLLIVMVLIRKH